MNIQLHRGNSVNTRSKSEKFWDRIAKYFDWVEKKDEPVNLAIIEKTKNLIYSNGTVLDFGCGSGTAAIALASSVNKIIGIDISSKMIELAKRKAKEQSVSNIDFMHATLFHYSKKEIVTNRPVHSHLTAGQANVRWIE
jgi:ubiquinone/menaquinone biosynthesis C-methylase UbiE